MKKMIIILPHLVEVDRHLPEEHGRVNTSQALPTSPAATRSHGNWPLARPLLGPRDPDASTPSLRAPAENVALVDYSKGRKLLEEAVDKAEHGDNS